MNFIDSLKLDNGTNLERAMTNALAMKDVNVVYVITDGVPTFGERNFTKLARRIRQLNTANARIFTVGLVGENPDGTDQSFEAAGLLREVAQQNNGEFRWWPTPSDVLVPPFLSTTFYRTKRGEATVLVQDSTSSKPAARRASS
jgi:hypothetical protein